MLLECFASVERQLQDVVEVWHAGVLDERYHESYVARLCSLEHECCGCWVGWTVLQAAGISSNRARIGAAGT